MIKALVWPHVTYGLIEEIDSFTQQVLIGHLLYARNVLMNKTDESICRSEA